MLLMKFIEFMSNDKYNLLLRAKVNLKTLTML